MGKAFNRLSEANERVGFLVPSRSCHDVKIQASNLLSNQMPVVLSVVERDQGHIMLTFGEHGSELRQHAFCASAVERWNDANKFQSFVLSGSHALRGGRTTSILSKRRRNVGRQDAFHDRCWLNSSGRQTSLRARGGSLNRMSNLISGSISGSFKFG